MVFVITKIDVCAECAERKLFDYCKVPFILPIQIGHFESPAFDMQVRLSVIGNCQPQEFPSSRQRVSICAVNRIAPYDMRCYVTNKNNIILK